MSNEKVMLKYSLVFLPSIPVSLGFLSFFHRLGTILCGLLTLMVQFMACWVLQSMAILNLRQITMFVSCTNSLWRHSSRIQCSSVSFYALSYFALVVIVASVCHVSNSFCSCINMLSFQRRLFSVHHSFRLE